MEFAGMDALTQVYMRAGEPVANCMVGDTKVFAFKAPKSGNLTLYVQKSALKAYKAAVCCEDADYSDMNGKNVRKCAAGDMIGKKSIKGVKSFEK
jgi:hypothetical protein